ncbi:hypothetical protein CK203_094838 [Vitis vinifera]|uniref:Uncharacterized protein n=1 Tax=Vitis vinifera TaxID=29760 RepID=A0A438DCG4_VITVI|nr:hypothetical protein CK203_094838 [Vitis vinifera]
MEDLQWARILVKSNGEDLPYSLEIGVEEATYILTLWWEVLPSLRQESGMKRGLLSRPSGEVKGDAGVGFDETRPHAQVGSLTRPFSEVGSSSSSPVSSLEGSKWSAGSSNPSAGEASKVAKIGPSCPMARPPFYSGFCKGCNLELEFTRFREKEVWTMQHSDSYRTMTDSTLEEEATRGRTPEMEYYDYSGALREGIQEGVGLRRPDADEHAEKKDGCWDLIEVNNIGPLERNSRWAIGQSESQEGRREKQFNWEENSLVKFSHFLGFSTKGLEKEILSFLVKNQEKGEEDTQ